LVWLVLAIAAAAHADPVACPAVAVTHGDEQAAAELGKLLAERGISGAAPAGCGALDVQIQPQGRRLRVSMKDPYGRVAVRTVRDLSTAATIVETWTRQALATEVTFAAAKTQEPAPEPTPVETTAAVAAVVSTPTIHRWAATASAETSASTDGDVWLGGAFGGCRLVHRFCVGVLGRAATDSSGAYARHDLAGLAAADFARGRGNWGFRAGLAAGLGWSDNDLHNDFHGVENESGFDLRLRVHVTASRALSDALALEAGVTLESALLARDATVSPHVIDPGPGTNFVRFALALRFGGLGWER
jgi:hypothetical protein